MTNQPKDEFDAILNRISTTGEFASKPVVTNAATGRPAGTHTCQQCGGSGRFLGYNHNQNGKCFACGGKGYFMKSSAERFKARQQRVVSKEKNVAAGIVAFDEQHAGLRAFLAGAASWSEFAASLHAALLKYGHLTEKQEAAAIGMRSKCDERQAAKGAAKAAAQVTQAAAEPAMTFARLSEAFLTAGSHLQYPKLRLRTEDGLDVVLSRAGAASRNAGEINVTDGRPYGSNTYYGRISPAGVATMRTAPASVVALLVAFNTNPQAEILVQGQRTSRCCCCGKKLTREDSIERGMGAWCAGQWGF